MTSADDIKTTVLRNEVVETIRAKMRKDKGAFWSRKVIYVSGMKVILHSLKDAKPEMAESMMSMMATDLIEDMKDHYRPEEMAERLSEFMHDCDELLDALLKEAEKVGLIGKAH